MNLIEQAIESYWGERCSDYEEGCVVCEAWRDYDNLVMDNKIANEIASKLAHVNNNMLIEDLLRHPVDIAIRNAISRLIVERKIQDDK
jgi:hypothetical protein